MKRITKILSVLMIMSMLFFAYDFGTYADTTVTTAYLDCENGIQGDTVNVDVCFSSGNVGSVTMNLDYNPDELELVSANTFIAGLQFKYNSTVSVDGQNEIRFTGINDDATDVSVTGIVMRVEFKILKASGTSSLKLTPTAYRAGGEKLSADSSSDNIKIFSVGSSVVLSDGTKVSDIYSEYKNISNTVSVTDKDGVILSRKTTVRNGDQLTLNDNIKIPIVVS